MRGYFLVHSPVSAGHGEHDRDHGVDISRTHNIHATDPAQQHGRSPPTPGQPWSAEYGTSSGGFGAHDNNGGVEEAGPGGGRLLWFAGAGGDPLPSRMHHAEHHSPHRVPPARRPDGSAAAWPEEHHWGPAIGRRPWVTIFGKGALVWLHPADCPVLAESTF